jgi:hypothetical protein
MTGAVRVALDDCLEFRMPAAQFGEAGGARLFEKRGNSCRILARVEDQSAVGVRQQTGKLKCTGLRAGGSADNQNAACRIAIARPTAAMLIKPKYGPVEFRPVGKRRQSGRFAFHGLPPENVTQRAGPQANRTASRAALRPVPEAWRNSEVT